YCKPGQYGVHRHPCRLLVEDFRQTRHRYLTPARKKGPPTGGPLTRPRPFHHRGAGPLEPGDKPPDGSAYGFGVTCCGTGGPVLLGIGKGLASRILAGVQSPPAAGRSSWVTVSLPPEFCFGVLPSSAAWPRATVADVVTMVSARFAKK